MTKDPYYRKILEGLDGPLDRDLFEACAVDLLRDVYPGLVPVRGGGDYGQDGAIADGEGPPFPLITTTSAKGGLENLRKNLDSYVSGGGPQRKAVFATSRAKSPEQRKNLTDAARERGFELVQIHGQWDFASRLYRNSSWTLELLGVTGEPSALSALPRTRRPLRDDLKLVGRDDDLDWLQTTSGDRLIVGQPGSGKTYLLLQLVREGRALFLASDDEERIASDLRDLEPEIVLVDDAHVEPERLDRLRYIRDDIGAEFDILATTWPGRENDILDALGHPPLSNVRELELLTRRQIVEVFRSMGIDLPADDPDLHLLVDQAANKPGLAVTLGSLWLRGEKREIFTGKALKASLLPSLRRVLSSDPTELLACFALGGDYASPLEVVGEFLGVGREEMRRRAADASQGGVLSVAPFGLTVQPPALRPALLAEVFFGDGPSLPYGTLLDTLGYPLAAIVNLALAALRGVAVPELELRELVQEHGTSLTWQLLARRSANDARWVLDHYQGSILDIARALLETSPESAIPALLETARTENPPHHTNLGPSLKLIQQWLQEIPLTPGSQSYSVSEVMARRQKAVQAVLAYLDRKLLSIEETIAASTVCLLTLDPWLATDRWAVTGDSLSHRTAVLPETVNGGILDLWNQMQPAVSQNMEELWPHLHHAISQWIHPPGLSEEKAVLRRPIARKILRDLASHGTESVGLKSALRALGQETDLDLSLPVDEDYEALFPPFIRNQKFSEVHEILELSATALGEEWATRSSEPAVQRLAYLERQANAFGRTRNMTWDFGRALASKVKYPGEWTSQSMTQNLDPLIVRPLLQRSIDERISGWEGLLSEAIANEKYSELAADLILRTGNLPELLIDVALSLVDPFTVETVCRRGAPSHSTSKKLLGASRETVAWAAVSGIWGSDPEEQVSTEIEPCWRNALLRIGSEVDVESRAYSSLRYCLKEIFRARPDLAAEWLQARVERTHERTLPDDVFGQAVAVLDLESRRRLLDESLAQNHRLAIELVPMLVGESRTLYQALLSCSALELFHLLPLAQPTLQEKWADFARLAASAGHEPEAIVSEITQPHDAIEGWSGEIPQWQTWKTRFEEMLNTETGPFREVAVQGLRRAEEEIARAKSRTHHLEITGQLY